MNSINFIYEYPSDYHSNGVIKVEIGFCDNVNFPLTFQVIGLIDNRIYWETKNMVEGHWSLYPDACNKKAIIIDSNNYIIKEWIWNQEEHGDKIHKDFYEWCLLNKGANGIAIGTHDGSSGEWVSPIREKLINGYLVEPSDMQFEYLCNNYINYSNVSLIQKLITKNGGYVDFFEGGEGYTNSVNKEFVLVYNNNDENLVHKVQKESITINQLIIDCGLKDNINWLHIDVEGIDDELIMSLDDKLIKLPDIIIYEDLNLSSERKNELNKWLESKNYKFYHSGFNTMAKKQPIKVSVIIPCYNYSKYIEQCLMSVMLQNIDFNIEVLIGDDNSSDCSFDIIRRFCECYKKDNIIFKYFSHENNIGEINNTKFLLENSNGEYIAYLDADDYWIDPDKLKKQIEFMDNNLDYSLCITGHIIIENDQYIPVSDFSKWLCPTNIDNLDSKSLTKYNIVGSSSSRFFRNYKNIVKDYFYEFPFSDWPMNFELSLKGKIGYLNFPSYIYRIHDKSLSKITESIVNDKRISLLENLLENNIDLSLLIHTCDSYEKYWSGMFYTLDFYWDYNYIPVYFANEEKEISDIIIDCKGTLYKPDHRIKQILTGKTDKNGFSTRFIEAVKNIPTKYVLYMQEDMWLKRGLDKELLKDLIKFMDDKNATSLRLHTKLWYYDSYILQPTDFFIKGQRVLKNVGESILSHNATIWRKDYILNYQLAGEDPWLNEIEGSKRMQKDNDNNYHYNIHWYCQPGIADNGEPSQEHTVYAHIVDEMKSMELKLNLKK